MNATQLKKYFEDKKFTYSSLNKLMQDKQLYDELYKMYDNYKDRFSFNVFVKYFILDLCDKKCLICGKLLTYNQIKDSRIYCSSKCSNNSDDVKNKIRNSLMNHFGVEHSAQSPQIKEKMMNTNLARRGCNWVMQDQNVKNKAKITNFYKYGYNYAMQNKDVMQKMFDTNEQKYGCKTMLCNNQLHNKINQQNMQNAILKLIDACKDYVVPMFSIQQYTGYNKNQVYKWKCVKCGNEFEQHIKTTNHNDVYRYMPRCLNCYPYMQNNGYSEQEKQLCQFVKSICDYQILQNDKTTINPYQLDIYIPQKKFAIQFDGLYWHSDKFKTQSVSQLKKTEMCQEKGIHLLHIFQDEWCEKKQIVKDRIKAYLGIYDKIIYGRNCQIKQVSAKESIPFVNANHLQGGGLSKIKIGLYYRNELVSIMTFGKPRFNDRYEYQLIRFCNKIGYKVIGAAGKLLKYFQKKYNPKTLISYADRRYSTGTLYYKLGFGFLCNAKPNYYWVNRIHKLTRYQCQKHKLSKVLGQKFVPQLSQNVNMRNNGYNKIYDCGNIVFVKNYQS